MHMSFGKHSGEDISDIPRKYLQWLLEQDWVEEKFPELHEAIEEDLAIRDRSYITD